MNVPANARARTWPAWARGPEGLASRQSLDFFAPARDTPQHVHSKVIIAGVFGEL